MLRESEQQWLVHNPNWIFTPSQGVHWLAELHPA